MLPSDARRLKLAVAAVASLPHCVRPCLSLLLCSAVRSVTGFHRRPALPLPLLPPACLPASLHGSLPYFNSNLAPACILSHLLLLLLPPFVLVVIGRNYTIWISRVEHPELSLAPMATKIFSFPVRGRRHWCFSAIVPDVPAGKYSSVVTLSQLWERLQALPQFADRAELMESFASTKVSHSLHPLVGITLLVPFQDYDGTIIVFELGIWRN